MRSTRDGSAASAGAAGTAASRDVRAKQSTREQSSPRGARAVNSLYSRVQAEDDSDRVRTKRRKALEAPHPRGTPRGRTAVLQPAAAGGLRHRAGRDRARAQAPPAGGALDGARGAG